MFPRGSGRTRTRATLQLLVVLLAGSQLRAVFAQVIQYIPAPTVTTVLGSSDSALPFDQPGLGTATRIPNVYSVAFCWIDRSLYYISHQFSALKKLTTYPQHKMSVVLDLLTAYGANQADGIALDDECTAYVTLESSATILKIPRGGAPTTLVSGMTGATQINGITVDTSRNELWVATNDGLYRVSASTGAYQPLASLVGTFAYYSGLFYDRTLDRLWLTDYPTKKIYYLDLSVPTPQLSGVFCGGGATGYYDGPCASAQTEDPRSGEVVRVPGGEWFFFTEYWNHRVRAVNLRTNEVVTVTSCANTGNVDTDGVGTSACIMHPLDFAYDSVRGDLYVTTESRIYKLSGLGLKPAAKMRVHGGSVTVNSGASMTVA